MRTDGIVARFRDRTRLRFKPTSEAPQAYIRGFRKFARSSRLERYTRLQLSGTRGKELLVSYVATRPLKREGGSSAS